MNSSKGIIDKILGDSQAIAEENFAQAKVKADEIISKSVKNAESELAKARLQLESDAKDIIDRRITVANLDVKKCILQEKKHGINMAIETSLNSIKKDKKAYLNLISAMIKANAKNDDTVVISKDDSDIIDQSFLNSIAKDMKINLKLAESYGDFKGGLMLCGTNYDKNLTLEVELDSLRETNESEIVELLYGER